jgi:hypothetical protein
MAIVTELVNKNAGVKYNKALVKHKAFCLPFASLPNTFTAVSIPLPNSFAAQC